MNLDQAQEQTLATLAARRWRVALALTAAMLTVYFGFILLVAFDKPFMGTLIAGGRLSIGILLGAMVIVVAPILTGIYVRWANRSYDLAVENLRRELASPRTHARAPRAITSPPPLPPPPVAVIEEARP